MKKKNQDKKEMILNIHCPSCKSQWGKINIKFESVLTKKDVIPNKKSYKFYDSDDNFICPICKYKYTMRDIFLLIVDNV